MAIVAELAPLLWFDRTCTDRAGVGRRNRGWLGIPSLRISSFGIRLLALLLGCCCIGQSAAQTGTFIDRQLATDLRVASFNIFLDSIFPVSSIPGQKFARVVNALDADILNLQEIHHSAAEVAELLNEIAPIAAGTWHTHKGRGNVIASKYPLSMLATSIDPLSDRPPAIALVDLPDAQFENDFYIVNHHYLCCGTPGASSPRDLERQQSSDAVVRWLRDARTPGELIDLSPGTPIAIVGDLNNVGGPGPLDTLVTGNILNESTYGPDSPPDWDGSSLTEAHPLHNGSGPADYTFRNEGSSYDLTRIDHIIYSDSALDIANKFVLNTVEMSPADLAATGLQTFDITIDLTGVRFDHLPVVADFRLFDFAASDFNFDRAVDHADIAVWESNFGLGNDGDSDGDGDTDGADFFAWQRLVTPSEADLNTGAIGIPEPSALTLALLLFLAATGYLRISQAN